MHIEVKRFKVDGLCDEHDLERKQIAISDAVQKHKAFNCLAVIDIEMIDNQGCRVLETQIQIINDKGYCVLGGNLQYLELDSILGKLSSETDNKPADMNEPAGDTRGLWVVACLLEKYGNGTVTSSQTISWASNATEAEAKSRALDYAIASKPGFGIHMMTTALISLQKGGSNG